MNDPKPLRSVHRDADAHWVGDGFPVRTLFAYRELGRDLSPFLLLDYGGPTHFEPTSRRRGVGAHPHRGFETVTIVFDGEVEHRDSSGGGGVIGPGDVQWMTAASGLVHEEFHGPAFARSGGRFEMVQLWVNLPKRHKMDPPRYQAIRAGEIPSVELADGAGRARVIAGEAFGARGPARTFTPLAVLDLRLVGGRSFDVPVPDGWSAALVVLDGALRVGDDEVRDAGLAVFERSGSRIVADVAADTHVLLLAGEPIDEPIAGMGPFVMNAPAELRQAILDFEEGRMGALR